MTQIQPFVFPVTGDSVRTLPVDGEPNFVAADICNALALTNITESLRRLDEDEFSLAEVVDSLGRRQQMYVVTEPGLYGLVLASRKPEARAFKRWIKHDVLPAIRKTGAYSIAEPTRKDLALMVLAAEEALEAAQQRADRAECEVLELAPAARMADELMVAEGDYSVREAAQILSRDQRIETGQGRLFRYLREIGWLDRRNLPYQRQIDLERLAVRASTYGHPHRDEEVATHQARVTPKGLAELHRLLGGQSQLPALMSEQVAA